MGGRLYSLLACPNDGCLLPTYGWHATFSNFVHGMWFKQQHALLMGSVVEDMVIPPKRSQRAGRLLDQSLHTPKKAVLRAVQMLTWYDLTSFRDS